MKLRAAPLSARTVGGVGARRTDDDRPLMRASHVARQDDRAHGARHKITSDADTPEAQL